MILWLRSELWEVLRQSCPELRFDPNGELWGFAFWAKRTTIGLWGSRV